MEETLEERWAIKCNLCLKKFKYYSDLVEYSGFPISFNFCKECDKDEDACMLKMSEIHKEYMDKRNVNK